MCKRINQEVTSAKAKYDDDLNEISREEWLALRQKRADEKKQRRVESLFDDWAAEMDNRDIRFDGKAPRTRTEKASLRCGCEHALRFDASLYQLERLARDTTCCTRCHEVSKAVALENVVKLRSGELLTPYYKAHEKVTVKCAEGHVFEATPANLTRKNGSWCARCRTGAGPGEGRLREILAERGLMLTDYGKHASDQDKMYLGWDGEEVRGHHSKLLATPPTYPTKRGRRRIRTFYNDTDMTAFVLADEVPPDLPEAIWDIVRKNDFIEGAAARNLNEAYAMVKDNIEADNQIGDYRVLNVLLNPLWVSPGQYTWGSIQQFDGSLVPTKWKED